jgi:hypothetical protein
MAYWIMWKSIFKYAIPFSLSGGIAMGVLSTGPTGTLPSIILASAKFFALFLPTLGLSASYILHRLFHRDEPRFYRNTRSGFIRPLALSVLSAFLISGLLLALVAGVEAAGA